MKIIDLLVKISQGEKMPKKIKYEGYVWEYDKDVKDYHRNDIDEGYIYLFQDLFEKATGFFINNEVEIIEEPKKIEHCLKSDRFLCDKAEIEHLRTKIDELIDEVNKLKGEK
jgi:hypothetical protein